MNIKAFVQDDPLIVHVAKIVLFIASRLLPNGRVYGIQPIPSI